MSNYLTRKKTLMGKRYEVEVPLAQYGGDVVRLHAIPDLELARIEDRCGYKLEDALAALSSQGLTEEEIKALKAEGPAKPEAEPKEPPHRTDFKSIPGPDPQAHSLLGVLGCYLQAAVQQLYSLVELAEVHIAEAQVVEKIGIVGILAEEFLQVDAGLV